jgi:hypothetical protein
MKVAETVAGVWQSYLNISDLEMPQFIRDDIMSFSVADPDPGWKNSDPGSWMEKVGSGINIPDTQH